MTQAGEAGIAQAITQVARQDSGRILAVLARQFGDLDLADEAVQQALIAAAASWPHSGLPANPPAWLLHVARRKAIDELRRNTSEQRRAQALGINLVDDSGPQEPSRMIDEHGAESVGDEVLRLMFLCCHPAIDAHTQVALTLRLVGGLTTHEIASAFLVPEATMAKRILRGKRKIRLAGIPLSIPADLEDRVQTLCSVLYLVFNEGYVARGPRGDLGRLDLEVEAIRLTRSLLALRDSDPEVYGLLALQLFVHARAGTRQNARGELVLLEDQDRSTWDLQLIEEANSLLGSALSKREPGPYQVQAVIASYHGNARTASDTDWVSIEGAYRQLLAMTQSPIVALNHAVAVAQADGPAAGLGAIDSIQGLDHYYLFHSTRGEICARLGRTAEAIEHFERALRLTENDVELRFLRGRLELLGH